MLPTKENISPEFLKENDGKLGWIRDDYLCMNGIQGTADPSYDFLEHVASVKAQARERGMVFEA